MNDARAWSARRSAPTGGHGNAEVTRPSTPAPYDLPAAIREYTEGGMRKHPQRKHCSLCARWCRTKAGICAPCAYYIRHAKVSPSWDLGLRDGHWVRRGVIQVWVSDGEAERELVPLTLTPEEQRDAHARFYLGHRDAETVRGEREYQRARKRIQRKRAA